MNHSTGHVTHGISPGSRTCPDKNDGRTGFCDDRVQITNQRSRLLHLAAQGTNNTRQNVSQSFISRFELNQVVTKTDQAAKIMSRCFA